MLPTSPPLNLPTSPPAACGGRTDPSEQVAAATHPLPTFGGGAQFEPSQSVRADSEWRNLEVGVLLYSEKSLIISDISGMDRSSFVL